MHTQLIREVDFWQSRLWIVDTNQVSTYGCYAFIWAAYPQSEEEYEAYGRDFVKKNIDNFVDPSGESVKSITIVAAAQADIVTAEFGLRPDCWSNTHGRRGQVIAFCMMDQSTEAI